MKKLFIDTNIIIDLLAQRAPFYESAAHLFALADLQSIQLTVSPLTFSNTYYILRKLLSNSKALDALRKLHLLVTVLPTTNKVIQLALSNKKFADFEDCIQYYTAIEGKQDVIITRNLPDFKHASIPCMSVDSYLTIQKK